jgi:fructose-bisphosphate aldolase class I
MPMLEPEVNIKSETRAECDADPARRNPQKPRRAARRHAGDAQAQPAGVPGTFDPLVDHPKVLRVVALSGGFKRPEACVELAKNAASSPASAARCSKTCASR